MVQQMVRDNLVSEVTNGNIFKLILPKVSRPHTPAMASRRLSMGTALKQKKGAKEVDTLAENDDAAELTDRAKRQKLPEDDEFLEEADTKRTSKKRKNDEITAASEDGGEFVQPRRVGVPTEGKSNQELADLYDKCLKLCSENVRNLNYYYFHL